MNREDIKREKKVYKWINEVSMRPRPLKRMHHVGLPIHIHWQTDDIRGRLYVSKIDKKGDGRNQLSKWNREFFTAACDFDILHEFSYHHYRVHTSHLVQCWSFIDGDHHGRPARISLSIPKSSRPFFFISSSSGSKKRLQAQDYRSLFQNVSNWDLVCLRNDNHSVGLILLLEINDKISKSETWTERKRQHATWARGKRAYTIREKKSFTQHFE